MREVAHLIEAAFEYASALIRKTADLFRQGRCDHDQWPDWRPALYEHRPARVCRYCKKIEHMTREDFYAYFGERVYRRLVEAEKEYE